MDIIAEKRALRKQMRAIRAAVTNRAEKSCAIWEQLRKTEEYRGAQVVFLYMSYSTEVETGGLLEQILADGKCAALPRVDGEQMDFYQVTGAGDLESGAWGILEPKKTCPCLTEADCILLPGLAFDRNGYRMGYGGGYYDRHMAGHQVGHRIALAFSEQVIETVPVEETDLPVEMIVTEEETYENLK